MSRLISDTPLSFVNASGRVAPFLSFVDVSCRTAGAPKHEKSFEF